MHTVNSEKSKIVVNAAANWLGFAVQIGITLYLTPILFGGLGRERYGIFTVVDSILTYLMLFDFGVGASVVRYVSKFEADADQERLNRVFSTSLFIFAVAGLAVFAVAGNIAWWATPFFNIPPEQLDQTRWLLVLLGLNLGLGFPLGVFACLLEGLRRFPAKIAIRTSLLIIRSIALVIVMRQGGGLIQVGAVITICSILEYIGMGCAVRSYRPGLRFSPALIDKETFHTIRGYGIHAFLIMVAGRICFQTDALVIFPALGAAAVAVFAIAARLVEYSKDSLRVITSVLTPAVSVLEARGDFATIRGLLIKSTRYVLFLILPVQIGLFVLGKPFIAVWMHDLELADQCYPILLILAAPLSLTISQSVSTRILYGTSRLRWFARFSLVEAVANLILSVILVQYCDLVGVALGTMIPNILMNLGLLVYICRGLHVPIADYLRRSFVPPFPPALLLAGYWIAAAWIWNLATWPGILIAGATGLLAYLLLAIQVEFGLRSFARQVRPFMRRGRHRQPANFPEESAIARA
jgi:O-antigen/teichoic acid export membrane protein